MNPCPGCPFRRDCDPCEWAGNDLAKGDSALFSWDNVSTKRNDPRDAANVRGPGRLDGVDMTSIPTEAPRDYLPAVI